MMDKSKRAFYTFEKNDVVGKYQFQAIPCENLSCKWTFKIFIDNIFSDIIYGRPREHLLRIN